MRVAGPGPAGWRRGGAPGKAGEKRIPPCRKRLLEVVAEIMALAQGGRFLGQGPVDGETNRAKRGSSSSNGGGPFHLFALRLADGAGIARCTARDWEESRNPRGQRPQNGRRRAIEFGSAKRAPDAEARGVWWHTSSRRSREVPARSTYTWEHYSPRRSFDRRLSYRWLRCQDLPFDSVYIL